MRKGGQFLRFFRKHGLKLFCDARVFLLPFGARHGADLGVGFVRFPKAGIVYAADAVASHGKNLAISRLHDALIEDSSETIFASAARLAGAVRVHNQIFPHADAAERGFSESCGFKAVKADLGSVVCFHVCGSMAQRGRCVNVLF